MAVDGDAAGGEQRGRGRDDGDQHPGAHHMHRTDRIVQLEAKWSRTSACTWPIHNPSTAPTVIRIDSSCSNAGGDPCQAARRYPSQPRGSKVAGDEGCYDLGGGVAELPVVRRRRSTSPVTLANRPVSPAVDRMTTW